MVAIMTEELDPVPGDRALEVEPVQLSAAVLAEIVLTAVPDQDYVHKRYLE